MTLNYDFDVFSVLAAENGDGGTADGEREIVALFRNQDTVDALMAADPRMRNLFEQSGFGIHAYASDSGVGQVPGGDLAAHAEILDRVSANVYEEYSEAEINEGGVLVNPSVGERAPENGAFVFMDWLNRTIAVHEGGASEQIKEVEPTVADRDVSLIKTPKESEADLVEAMRHGHAEHAPKPEKRRRILKRKRSRVLKPDQVAAATGEMVPDVSWGARMPVLDRLNSPLMGVVAGVLVGGIGIVLVSKLLA